MKIIVAVDERWGIGYKNDLLFSIPEDKSFFKRITAGKVVIMGYNTLKSLPKGLPLKNRVNIVLTRKEGFSQEGVIVCSSIKTLWGILPEYCGSDLFVIGGESIYAQLLNYCDEAYVTKVLEVREADRFFPDIDRDNNWEMAEESTIQTSGDISFRFCRYINKSPSDPASSVFEC